MNYRHSSLGQWFTPSPSGGTANCWQSGPGGSRVTIPSPSGGIPSAWPPATAEGTWQKGIERPKILASSWTQTTLPWCCCLCSVRTEVSSTQGSPGHADAEGHTLQLCSTIPFWHASGMVCETEIQGPSITVAHSHFQNTEFVNLLGTGYTRGTILYFILYFILFPTLPYLLAQFTPTKCYIHIKVDSSPTLCPASVTVTEQCLNCFHRHLAEVFFQPQRWDLYLWNLKQTNTRHFSCNVALSEQYI